MLEKAQHRDFIVKTLKFFLPTIAMLTTAIIPYGRVLLAENRPSVSIPNERIITTDNVNLTVDKFYSAYTSPNGNERSTAMLYLLGVLDATEGRSWCDYHTLKTVSIQEYIYEYLKKLPEHRREERASRVIEEALNKQFLCRSEK